MASGRKAPLVLLAVALTAVGVYFGSGLHPVPLVTWLAPLPILLLAPRVSAGTAAVAAFVGWLAGEANMWTYLLDTLGLPPVILLFPVGIAMVFGVAVLLFRALVRQGRFVLAAVAAPAVWATGDYLIAVVSPHGTFGSLAYTQAGVLPVAQIAAVTGIWGISFLLIGAASAVAALLAPGVSRRTVARLGVATAVVAASTLGHGAWRLVGDPPDGEAERIALIAVRPPAGEISASSPDGRTLLDSYVDEITAAAGQGARLVVLPEAILRADGETIGDVERDLSAVAEDQGVEIVVGLILFGPNDDETGDDRNAAIAFHADGSEPTTYYKQHLIPGAEPYEPGDALGLIPGTRGEWGIQICKDLDFPDLSRQYGEAGITLATVPAWDFDSDGWLHSRMAIMRGVENGFPMARTARSGALTLSDAYGRVIAEAGTGTAPSVTVVGDLTPHAVPTLYTRWGDWFAWLCGGLTLVTVAAALTRNRRRPPAQAPDTTPTPSPALA